MNTVVTMSEELEKVLDVIRRDKARDDVLNTTKFSVLVHVCVKQDPEKETEKC